MSLHSHGYLHSRNLFISTLLLFLLSFYGTAISSDNTRHRHNVTDTVADFTWSNGLSLFDSGYISTSLSMLDSLSRKEPENQTSIYTFAKKAFTLLSYNKKQVPENNLPILQERIIIDTTQITSFRCAIVNHEDSTGRSLPSFRYNAYFPVEKPCLLDFIGLQNRTSPSLVMSRETISTALDYELLDQISNKKDSISFSIFIDLNSVNLTIHDYLTSHFSEVFDSVAVKDDLKKYDALSLRGYNRKNWSIEKGKFTAIIAFDRLLPDRRTVKGKTFVAAIPVRYTVVVKSAGSVRELAEAKLQTLLKTL